MPLSFINRAGEYVAPWPVAERLAHRIVERLPDLVLASVAKEQRALQEKAVQGDNTGHRWQDERAAKAYVEMLRAREPIFEIVRGWCGQQAVDRYAEVEGLRTEVRRLRDLVLDAAMRLNGLGERRAAKRLRKALERSPEHQPRT